MAFVAACIYTVGATLWVVLSDQALLSRSLGASEIVRASSIKGGLFVVVTALLQFFVTKRYLAIQQSSEDRHLELQEGQAVATAEAMRRGYADVLDVVTGGQLVLLTEDKLNDELGQVILPLHELDDPIELSSARRTIAGLPEVLRLGDRDAFVLAVSEALTNALKHGLRGEYRVFRTAESVQVVIRDFGPGIDLHTLPRATLLEGFSTTNTMGLGFTIMFEACDRVLVATDGTGTVLVLEVALPAEPSQVTQATVPTRSLHRSRVLAAERVAAGVCPVREPAT